MANENNKFNELVSADDDPTAELELPTFEQLSETDAATFDVDDTAMVRRPPLADAELEDRAKTISRLQFDLEKLRAKWLGLETEIKAREEQTSQLNDTIESLETSLERKDRLLRKRDRRIRSLKQEIRQRDEQFRALQEDVRLLGEQAGRATELPPAQHANRDLPVDQLRRTETYADMLRRQVQDLAVAAGEAGKERDYFELLAAETRAARDELQQQLGELTAENERLSGELATLDARHEEEIRVLRFELGAAQDTVAENEQLNSELAADLLTARHSCESLEGKLLAAANGAMTEIEGLRKQIAKLDSSNEDLEQKLATKNEAITVLLAELARKTEQLESIGDLEDVIHDIDDRISDQMQARIDGRASAERVTRLLIGTVDGQLLRFPLFKDRLTIGRTADNDIQLDAAYISRRHAVVQTERDLTRIIDWGSKNGVFANGKRVTEYFLEHGDTVAIGNARFRYEERKKRDS